MIVKYKWRYRCKVCKRIVVAREYFGLEGGHYIENHWCKNMSNWLEKHPKADFLKALFTQKEFNEALP